MINVSQEYIASSRNFTSVKIKLTVNSQSHNQAQRMGSFLQGIIIEMSFKGSYRLNAVSPFFSPFATVVLKAKHCRFYSFLL